MRRAYLNGRSDKGKERWLGWIRTISILSRHKTHIVFPIFIHFRPDTRLVWRGALVFRQLRHSVGQQTQGVRGLWCVLGWVFKLCRGQPTRMGQERKGNRAREILEGKRVKCRFNFRCIGGGENIHTNSSSLSSSICENGVNIDLNATDPVGRATYGIKNSN